MRNWGFWPRVAYCINQKTQLEGRFASDGCWYTHKYVYICMKNPQTQSHTKKKTKCKVSYNVRFTPFTFKLYNWVFTEKFLPKTEANTKYAFRSTVRVYCSKHLLCLKLAPTCVSVGMFTHDTYSKTPQYSPPSNHPNRRLNGLSMTSWNDIWARLSLCSVYRRLAL